jgi:hypothetical protein
VSDIYERRIVTGEDELTAALLRMVLQHCGSTGNTLDSGAITANAEAMKILADDGLIRINEEFGRRVHATVLPEAEAFLAWMDKAP